MLILFGGCKTTLAHGKSIFLPGVPEMLDHLRTEGFTTGLWAFHPPDEGAAPGIYCRFTEGYLGDKKDENFARICQRYSGIVLVEFDPQHLRQNVRAARKAEIIRVYWEKNPDFRAFYAALEEHLRFSQT